MPDDDELQGLGHPGPLGQPRRGLRPAPARPARRLLRPAAGPLGHDLGRYLEGLHDALIGVLAEFDLKGTTRPDLPGVFLGQARVASVGVAVDRWIAYHGLTLNVGPFLGPFDLLDEPGPGSWPLRQTSMEARRQRPAPMAKVREALIRQVEDAFGLERHHVYTHHPLIRRKARAHVYAQSPG